VSVIRPVVLSGGSGTRLWPLSTRDTPKQFSSLFDGETLFERTLMRLHGRPGVEAPIVVTGAAHASVVGESAQRVGVGLGAMLIEPEGRNTAPACIAAALASQLEDVLVILPSDHLIRDVEAFAEAVSLSVTQAEQGRVAAYGITPDRPHTGYGYIEMGDDVGGARTVTRFKEKPDLEEATKLVADGRHAWNSGIFVVSASTMIEEAGAHCPDILDSVERSMQPPEDSVVRLGPEFATAQKVSFDHAVMEKTEKAVVVPINVGWDDVGSYEALWSVSDVDGSGNAVDGDVTLVDVAGSFVKSTSRRVAVAGMRDVVVVETGDAVLVVAKDRSQLVKDVVDRLGPG